jgi:adenylate kinase family enzyme
MNFPLFKTKIEGKERKFNLTDPLERRDYFYYKAGEEIEALKEFLEKNTFVCYFLGKKNSGKGTYIKMFSELMGEEKVIHLSVGDTVREVHQFFLENTPQKEEVLDFLNKNFRGFITLESAIQKLLSRDTKTLLPTELILSLLKWKISKFEKKAIFFDGFPRDLDQISYSLFFRELIGYRDDLDIFVFIDIPLSVIDLRMKYRVVCPKCLTPRNLKLLTTKDVGYDEDKKEFYLICDRCKERMVQKEGDVLGIEAIKERLEKDEELIKALLSLHGIEKIYLRNSIPVEQAKDYVDDYEITPSFEYQWNEKEKKVETIKKPLEVKDDSGILSYSLLPEPVVLSFIKQLAKIIL